MFQALFAALAIVLACDERVDDVVPREFRRERGRGLRRRRARCPMPRTAPPPVPREPHGEGERDEREERKNPRERLQELERVLCGVELVRAQDHDASGVLRDLVRRPAAPMPMRSAASCDDRPQVERHLAALRRDAVAAALEHLDERLVRLLERRLEERLEHRLLERAIDDLVRRLPEAGGGCAGEPLVVGRKLLLDLGLDVDVREELVDGAVRDGAPDLRVVEERARRVGEDARIERDAVDPDRERREQQEQAGDDEHDPDGSRASTALTAPRLGCRRLCGGAHRR